MRSPQISQLASREYCSRRVCGKKFSRAQSDQSRARLTYVYGLNPFTQLRIPRDARNLAVSVRAGLFLASVGFDIRQRYFGFLVTCEIATCKPNSSTRGIRPTQMRAMKQRWARKGKSTEAFAHPFRRILRSLLSGDTKPKNPTVEIFPMGTSRGCSQWRVQRNAIGASRCRKTGRRQYCCRQTPLGGVPANSSSPRKLECRF